MTIERATELLLAKYEIAKETKYVQNPVAWSLHQVWKMADRARTGERVASNWHIASDGYYPYCPACGEAPESGKMSPYCPSCGAKLD
jgi:rubrerythrin